MVEHVWEMRPNGAVNAGIKMKQMVNSCPPAHPPAPSPTCQLVVAQHQLRDAVGIVGDVRVRHMVVIIIHICQVGTIGSRTPCSPLPTNGPCSCCCCWLCWGCCCICWRCCCICGCRGSTCASSISSRRCCVRCCWGGVCCIRCRGGAAAGVCCCGSGTRAYWVDNGHSICSRRVQGEPRSKALQQHKACHVRQHKQIRDEDAVVGGS